MRITREELIGHIRNEMFSGLLSAEAAMLLVNRFWKRFRSRWL